jgi:UDP-N-acetylmuramate--alanine ligase
VESFGFGPGADWRAVNLRAKKGSYTFRVTFAGRPFGQFSLKLAGEYNVANALAVCALAHEAGISIKALADSMATYDGVERRMTFRGRGRGVTIVDDYAHHPTEIRVTLDAVRRRYSPKRTWVVFQPHQASRTRHLLEEFSRAFDQADVVLVPDIYSVRDTEEDRRSVGSAHLVERICSTGTRSIYLPTMKAVTDHVESHAADGDLVVVMGAGDVWKVADELVERMC